ncbi:MAG: aspartate carbamoyltransferase catalytic subunit [Candidatus Omnitrophica bacterium]|nr:aspartate carbamoyltransferase catalytic subunit [Candidatus Omnitrophota bacterium]MDD5351632.1 aspartate carbamoyltransferase catalytic subunit [Candidatus Omnitrophota bacterium]MDD5550842.1 aspartate carbamoyltransferase catalytic subunit [Candidatus Omnitrophota bacterium]
MATNPSNKTKWNKKDLLGLEELTKEEIELVLDTADSFKEVLTREVKKVPTLRGKTVVLLFLEPSTRTRTSFELAAKRLSADTISIAGNSSSIVKGESLTDTAKNIEAMNVDVIVLRHMAEGSAYMLSKQVDAAVINAGDGCHEHPTQALLDIMTIRERKQNIQDLKIAIVGDIAHSRVARSNIWGLKKLGAHVIVCGPATLMPKDVEELGVEVSYDINDAIKDADVINVLRLQMERQKEHLFPSIREYIRLFGIDKERLTHAKKDVLILHPGPVNRGIELSADVADSPYALILNQVTNGIAVRMAVLYLLGVQKGEKQK